MKPGLEITALLAWGPRATVSYSQAEKCLLPSRDALGSGPWRALCALMTKTLNSTRLLQSFPSHG